MIPPDAASRLRLTLPDQPLPTQPTTPAQKLADALSDLVPGQRILAEIQALLPNGTYRAVVGQRDVTLALPFSAKAGDSLELEVVDTNGRISLAFVANRGDGKAAEPQSVATQLSQAGRLIGDLLSGIGEDGKRPQPAPLNGNLPLVGKMPESAAELVPLLKDALVKSGMFYEAHQARWVEGKLPTAVLLEQPQGKLSTAGNPATPLATRVEEGATGSTSLPPAPQESASAAKTTSPVPAPLVPLVQQQLDALATQTYVWQGQVWPGQDIHWEISEDGSRRPGGPEDEAPERWQTRLKLALPNLGGIEASIRLRADDAVDISLTTASESSRGQLLAFSPLLQRQLEVSGLTLTSCAVRHDENPA